MKKQQLLAMLSLLIMTTLLSGCHGPASSLNKISKESAIALKGAAGQSKEILAPASDIIPTSLIYIGPGSQIGVADPACSGSVIASRDIPYASTPFNIAGTTKTEFMADANLKASLKEVLNGEIDLNKETKIALDFHQGHKLTSLSSLSDIYTTLKSSPSCIRNATLLKQSNPNYQFYMVLTTAVYDFTATLYQKNSATGTFEPKKILDGAELKVVIKALTQKDVSLTADKAAVAFSGVTIPIIWDRAKSTEQNVQSNIGSLP